MNLATVCSLPSASRLPSNLHFITSILEKLIEERMKSIQKFDFNSETDTIRSNYRGDSWFASRVSLLGGKFIKYSPLKFNDLRLCYCAGKIKIQWVGTGFFLSCYRHFSHSTFTVNSGVKQLAKRKCGAPDANASSKAPNRIQWNMTAAWTK